jgi:hypothetical protein
VHGRLVAWLDIIRPKLPTEDLERLYEKDLRKNNLVTPNDLVENTIVGGIQ